MSPNRPPSSQPEENHGVYYVGKVGQRTQMTRAHNAPHPPPVLPPPSQLLGSRPQLPPLSDLPTFSGTPLSSARYTPAAFLERPPISFGHAPPYGPPPLPSLPRPQPSAQQPGQSGPVSSFSHPPLYPQRASFQSKNPGTVYEALSAIEYGSAGHVYPFNQAPYDQSPYASGPVSTFQSPTSSHRSSATSSSGVRSVEGSARPSDYQPSIPRAIASPPQPLNPMNDRYILTIRQQPLAARACGFGERDRRVIDPPPIVQLSLKDYDPTSKSDLAELQFPFNITHCALLSASLEAPKQRQPTSAPQPYAVAPASSDVTAVADPNSTERISRRLMGTLVASPFIAVDPEAPESKDQHARLGAFFIFSDLSCRQNGRYRLRFTLMKVPMGPYVSEGKQGSVCGSVDSDEFEVFSAKDFPGMRASSKLIRELKRQGAAVTVRKGKDRSGKGERMEAGEGRVEKRASSVSGSGDDDDDDDEEGSLKWRKKRG